MILVSSRRGACEIMIDDRDVGCLGDEGLWSSLHVFTDSRTGCTN